MNKTIAIPIIALAFFCGCSKPKPEIYIPSRWTTMEYIKEINIVWYLHIKDLDVNDTSQLRMIVQKIWEADRDGKTDKEIQKAFETRVLKDILKNGI
jgi:hypothetical protein